MVGLGSLEGRPSKHLLEKDSWLGHLIWPCLLYTSANAFEQVLEEKTPRFHRFLRCNYDRYGYPFAKHIKKKWAMDLIYYLMKPLEWIFLLVLYLVDRKPENRIAMQYIKPIPEDFDPKKAS